MVLPFVEPGGRALGPRSIADGALRLERLAELGFDDAVLVCLDHRDETLAAIRGLI